jgi:hypothetical protein
MIVPGAGAGAKVETSPTRRTPRGPRPAPSCRVAVRKEKVNPVITAAALGTGLVVALIVYIVYKNR